MDKYIFNKEIGSGSFGKVFLVEAKQSGVQYVVKQIDLNKLDKKQSSTAPKEVEVLSKLKHNNIVRYKESFEEKRYLNIVMEYCENGDLHTKIKEKRLRNEYFNEDEILDYFVQICLALEYIHDQRILHRDLKSKNIFLTKGNAIKLGDFGIAKVLENSLELAQTCIGSPFYISPEICENKPYDKKSDVWALGCVLYELTTLKYAFVAKNMKFLLTRIITGIYSPIPNHVNLQIRNLIAVLLKPNPKDRPAVSSILKKPFLEKYRLKYSCEVKKTNLDRKRSKSGEVLRSFSNVNKNALKNRVLSSSCLKLNEPPKKNLTKPEVKYTPPVFPNRVKSRFKRFPSAENNLNNAQKIKITSKLPKVDSQYYNLIAESQRKEINSNKCSERNRFASLDKVTSKFLVHNQNKMEDPENKEMFLDAEDEFPNLIKNENLDEAKDFHDNRKKWITNTFDREKLIEILNEADLINSSLSNTVLRGNKEGTPIKKLSVDDMLRLDPLEISADVLLPIKIESCHKQEEEDEKSDVDYYDLLKEEVKLIKDRYRKNKSYKLMDLVHLTENSRRILILQICRAHCEGKQKNDSLYFSLELRRMQLEKNIGLYLFLKTYRKMMSILNGEFMVDEKKNANGSETYTVCKSGDEIRNLKKSWEDVIDLLGDNQKYLPDIWELTISENICYQE